MNGLWEFFCSVDDSGHYGLWAVKQVTSQKMFHVQSREEAMELSAVLNEYEFVGMFTQLKESMQ